jgi:lysophospholipase L1-like esterase
MRCRPPRFKTCGQSLASATIGGDHLHPGNAGYAAMADAIDLRELQE